MFIHSVHDLSPQVPAFARRLHTPAPKKSASTNPDDSHIADHVHDGVSRTRKSAANDSFALQLSSTRGDSGHVLTSGPGKLRWRQEKTKVAMVSPISMVLPRLIPGLPGEALARLLAPPFFHRSMFGGGSK